MTFSCNSMTSTIDERREYTQQEERGRGSGGRVG